MPRHPAFISDHRRRHFVGFLTCRRASTGRFSRCDHV